MLVPFTRVPWTRTCVLVDGCTYVDWKLARYPDELGGIGLQLLDATCVGLADVGGVSSKGVDDLEVMTEHVRVLVILLGDVLADGRRE